MNPEDVRRMVAGWQMVEERKREERRKAESDAAPAVARRPGRLKDRIHIGPDFDEPLPEEILSAFRDGSK